MYIGIENEVIQILSEIFQRKKKKSVSHADTMALSFSNDMTSMHNHVMYLWILCVF